MKLAWKIFCMAYLMVMLTVGIGGFVLVSAADASITDSRVQAALESNEYAGKLFYALTEQDATAPKPAQMQDQLARLADASAKLSIRRLEDLTAQSPSSFSNLLQPSQQGYALLESDGAPTLQIVCRVDYAGQSYYIETLSDISDVYAQRDKLVGYYRYTVLAVALLSGAVLLVFSLYIAHPLKRLSQATNQIAAGKFQKRISVKHGMGSEEIRRLSNDFNAMAEAVERTVGELREEIEKRELFIADFTHELKTPMTSIIGYADMLRSYNLNERERREAADAIYQEGKRLERLAMQLLDILVLQHQKLELKPIRSVMIFERFALSARFLREKYGVEIVVRAEPAIIKADATLLLSLLFNLVDNACKASEKMDAVILTGIVEAGRYKISVADHGRGISPAHLSKIMEPFYMEDKSRSRKQGGAGLGLALCKRIADLHGTRLQFASELDRGTVVTFDLETADGGPEGADEA